MASNSKELFEQHEESKRQEAAKTELPADVMEVPKSEAEWIDKFRAWK